MATNCSQRFPGEAVLIKRGLFAGFTQAKALSHKMVTLYRLASQQLSQQDHYDFGMRALKSVLTMAGSLRQNKPGKSEPSCLPSH